MDENAPDTDQLIRQARSGDESAVHRLLQRHRTRLRQMVAIRMDPRLGTRLDPSDVVQDVLAEASRRLPAYLDGPPLPFYPWLRQMAWDRLVDLHRRHVRARRRAVSREQGALPLTDASEADLVIRLAASGTTPSGRFARAELQHRVRTALGRLAPADREVLVLRHLEELSTKEIATVLRVSIGAVKTRHLRALQRLRQFLEDDQSELKR